MAIPTFNDGDPIDAAVLATLAQEVARLQASIPGGATSGSTINIVPKADSTIPQVLGGKTDKITLSAGNWKPFTITFPTGTFTKTPNAITLTPYSSATGNGRVTYAAQVVKLTKDNAECKVRSVSGDIGDGAIYMYYIAVQNS
jgi:hypothetical protein